MALAKSVRLAGIVEGLALSEVGGPAFSLAPRADRSHDRRGLFSSVLGTGPPDRTKEGGQCDSRVPADGRLGGRLAWRGLS